MPLSTLYGSWFQLQLPSASVATSYNLLSRPDLTLNGWSLFGSNNGSAWALLDSKTNTAIPSWSVFSTFSITSPASYLYYRVAFTSTTGAGSVGLQGFSVTVGGTAYPPPMSSSSENGYTTTNSTGWAENGGPRTNWYFLTVNTLTNYVGGLTFMGSDYNNAGAYSGSNNTAYGASVPLAPTLLSWSDNYNGSVKVNFTAPDDQGAAITNYQYSLNGGSFDAFSPAQTASPLIVSGLSQRTPYSLVVKAVNSEGAGASSNTLTFRYLCFLEGTKLLCYDPVLEQEIYRPIESLNKGDLVKTLTNGYKPIDTIGSSKIYNPDNNMRSKYRLYQCTQKNYSELFEDLVITGCHSILVPDISEKQREQLMEEQGKIYVTEKNYRLIACVDERAQPYEKEGLFNIWHLALEHPNYTFNYGVYANGLLVETSSVRMMREMSGMDLKL